jgi:hypothetical protein
VLLPDLYRFSPGRALWAMRQVQQRALPMNKAEIAALAAIGVSSAQEALDLLLRVQGSLSSLLTRLTGFNDQYGTTLAQALPRTTRETLREAEQRCQEVLEALVGLIIGHFRLHEPENTAGRDHLLEPILQQNAAIRAARRLHRPRIDVDPETGEELPAPGPDAPA